MRALIVERLTGDTGEPQQVIDAARGTAERAAPVIAEGLAKALSIRVGVSVSAVRLSRMADARPVDANRSVMAAAASTSSPDAVLMTMGGASVALVVAAFFGAEEEASADAPDRAPSPTDLDVATMIFQEVASAVNGSGPRAFDLRLPVAAAVSGDDIARLASRDGPAVCVSFLLDVPTGTAELEMTVPQRVMLKHRGGTGTRAADPAAQAEWQRRFSGEVMRSGLRLEATAPLKRMKLGEIAALQVGQLIELDENARTTARLSVRGKPLFVCEFGKLGQNYTVRVRHPYDAGQELMDGLMPGAGRKAD